MLKCLEKEFVLCGRARFCDNCTNMIIALGSSYRYLYLWLVTNKFQLCWTLITSAEEVMFSRVSVRLSVNKITRSFQALFMKRCSIMDYCYGKSR